MMKIKSELHPTITKTSKDRYLVNLWYNQKRFRFSCGSVIGLDLYPNQVPLLKRREEAELLLSAFKIEIKKGWIPITKKPQTSLKSTVVEICKKVYDQKLNLNYSNSYKNDLRRTMKLWALFCKEHGISNLDIADLKINHIREFVYAKAPSSSSTANLKRNISALLKEEAESSGNILRFSKIKVPKSAQELHRPIEDVSKLLNEIKSYNDNLYICCLLTYGLLLRPHREIRCLTVGDFKSDFSQVSLSGNRVKSKRNRILPIPRNIQSELKIRFTELNKSDNLFTRNENLHHQDYFKGLWTKFKNQSTSLELNQTLYSFRHTGAIKVFEKTGSLIKLQQVMGHSDMKVSLTYLRGLEVKQLDVEDLPEL
jgi:site-specific recombinase XerD